MTFEGGMETSEGTGSYIERGERKSLLAAAKVTVKTPSEHRTAGE